MPRATLRRRLGALRTSHGARLSRSPGALLRRASVRSADVAGEDFVHGLQPGVLQGMRIWSNEIRWARQFYSKPA